MSPTTLTIRQVWLVKAPVATVFRAVTEPTELKRWFLADAHFPPKRGERYDFTWQGGFRHEGSVLDFVKNRRISLTWPNRKLGDTRVTFSFRRASGGTRLEVRHSGYKKTDAWLKVYGGTEAGWAYFLMNLKSVLEHGNDLREPADFR